MGAVGGRRKVYPSAWTAEVRKLQSRTPDLAAGSGDRAARGELEGLRGQMGVAGRTEPPQEGLARAQGSDTGVGTKTRR